MKTWMAAGIVFLLAHGAFAQSPHVVNAQFDVRAVSGTADAFVQTLVTGQARPAWIGYAVPAVRSQSGSWEGDGQYYYGNGSVGCGPYYLEGRPAGAAATSTESGAAKADAASATLFVLFRAEQGAIGRVRLFSPGCPLDAGGLPFTWLTGMGAADSVRLLTTVARGSDARVARSAVTAIALHDDPLAVDTLLRMAREDSNAGIRGQAIFWLAETAGRKAVSTITNAIDNDPETEVKERAVFALSRLSRDEGIPLLINVARTNRNPRIRQRAMFWLGESKDERAVAFFEQVLKQGR